MTKFNRTPMSAVVNAVFSLSIKDKDGNQTRLLDAFRNLQQMTYVPGLFPIQDVRVAKSILWGLRNAHVSLQYVSTKPLQDQPQEGSLEANDTGRGDEQAEERNKAIDDNEYLQAVVERHLVSLQKQVRSDYEEAGERQEDGGRLRFKLHNAYRPSDEMDALEDWYSKQLAQTPAGSRRYLQIIASQERLLDEDEHGETVALLPHVGAQEANDVWNELVSDADDRFTKLANRDWDSIRELLTDLGNELYRHAGVMAQLNDELAAVHEAYSERTAQQRNAGPVKAAMAIENTTHRENINRPLWMLGRKFEAVALLAHVGVPQDILNSPEWRAAEAKQRAAEARAKAQEAQAQMLEVEANMMEMEANMLLMESRRQLAEMQKAMNAQMAEMRALMNPPKEAKAKAKAKAKA